MYPLKSLLFFIVVLFFFQSCKTEKDTFNTDLGHDYLALEVGKYITYEVDSTIFDPTGDSLIAYSKTYFKEEIVDTLHDNNEHVLYRTERYERRELGASWQVTKVFTQSIQDNQGIVTEDNLRFIKMGFPVRENNSWDGLVHFDPSLIVIVAGESLQMFKGWDYRIESVDEAESVGAFPFENVMTLREADNENLIELRVSREKYAKGIGLVYRERWILDTQCIDGCTGMTWEEKAEKGFILRQTIIDHN